MRSSVVLLHCEKLLRYEMHKFIAHEVDLTSFAERPPFWDLETSKAEMHKRARCMELSMEMEHLSSRLVLFIMQPLQAARQVSRIESLTVDDLACRALDKWPLNVTKYRTSYFNINYDSRYITLDIDQTACASCILYLPFTNEMRTDLHRRLIEATKRHSVIHCRHLVNKVRSKQLRMDQNNDYKKVVNWKRAAKWKAEHACLRERFLTRLGLEPPQLLRVIDIEATCRQRERVVLIDYRADGVQQRGYTAISHTYGLPVYEVFDCKCASECSAELRPRSLDKPCPYEQYQDASSVGTGSGNHKSVVNDILRMCDILRKAGVSYAWHDGVCIAQHDESEVTEAIMHMGWIYANAKETIIFLHYVGNPMAPIRNSNVADELCCRWHTRVWTLQEAALSKCRRYCVRVGASPLGDCQSLEELEEKVDLWYGEDSSTIEIIEEETFFEILRDIDRVLHVLRVNTASKIRSMPDDADDDEIAEAAWMLIKISKWNECTMRLLETLLWTCFKFPSVEMAIEQCAPRQSKHLGDYINSILALAEVKGFVAPKDKNVEASTIEFFKRQGQRGLAMAVFSINNLLHYDHLVYIAENSQHTWPPIFGSMLVSLCDTPESYNNNIGFEVLEDGRLELRAELVCVKVRFTAVKDVRFSAANLYHKNKDVEYSAAMYVNALEARADLSCLDMDLNVYHTPSSFGAKLSENSGGFTRRAGTNSGSDNMIMGSVYISTIKKCDFGRARPALAREIEDGDSIHDIHLVIPPQLDRNILIVQGSLDSQYVSKVGLFKPSCKAFVDLVAMIRHLPAVTTIHRLVII